MPTKTLAAWPALNLRLRATKAEEGVKKMIEEEMAGPNRQTFILRMHSRYNHLRAARERLELSRGKNIFAKG